MPFVKMDQEQEQMEFIELIKDPVAKSALEEFEREYAFRQKLAQARKMNNVSQQDIQERTGLPQQSISKIEKGTAQKQSPTLRTLLKYVDAIGYELTIIQK